MKARAFIKTPGSVWSSLHVSLHVLITSLFEGRLCFFGLFLEDSNSSVYSKAQMSLQRHGRVYVGPDVFLIAKISFQRPGRPSALLRHLVLSQTEILIFYIIENKKFSHSNFF